MSLNDMEMPQALLVDFYKHDLVNIMAGLPALKNPAETKDGFAFLGKNLRKIALLVSYEHDVYLPEPQLQFLTSILAACKLNLGDVAIVNTAKQPLTPEAIARHLSPGFIIGFGVDAQSIGYPEEPLLTIAHLNGMQLVWAPSPEMLNGGGTESKTLKGKLWLCLKAMFNV